MAKTHRYKLQLEWTGNTGTGTSDYRAYTRDHVLHGIGKPNLFLSSDPAFRGDPARYNPEEMLLGALSSCHMLWYLHLCADAGVVVIEYKDNPEGVMIETADGGGRFSEVVLHPEVVVKSAEMIETARSLHAHAHTKCFIANSCNFPVRCENQCTAS
ncbi:MAG: OsmC family protein [Bacteroidetes bacterium]|nr:OsmC family protein [Bacteroidota bacterium]